ncbi:Zinc transporter ZIP14 [Orchesella cincta]|uniref:Zinc transporter ZIP14 n=1 Tax=Orchesella cincta TaxID=48709 RepID=A0A1D2N684_ORCCI|nr:Zinc transporter ZIP14 [Orchesella cincta]
MEGLWGYGFLLVTIISCSSLVGVSLMPFMAKDFYKHLLTVMIGLAVGSLTGSAVFHLLPQALRLAEHDPDHEYLNISLYIVGGIWLFFMVERILKFIMDYKERKGKSWKREKMSSVLSSTPETSTIAVMTENGNLMKGPLVEANGGGGEQRNSLIFPSTPRDTGVIYECQEQAIKASFGHQEKPRLSSCHDHPVTFEQGKDSVIATVAWMIIFGDGLHNFIDGLSIGAAFNESIWTGVSISLAVLCEELPHELGDFAVLLNAGMSMRQAVTYNFLSACTCYIGMAVGILLGEIEASIYIFALAGGMFLYISLVDMVPEMNEIAQETSKVSVRKGIITLFLQNMGLFAGITALYLLAKYQDRFQF